MTITEMRNRLTEIIEDNEKHGRSDRNKSDVAVRVQKSKHKFDYRSVRYLSSAWLGLGENLSVFEIATDKILWKNYK